MRPAPASLLRHVSFLIMVMLCSCQNAPFKSSPGLLDIEPSPPDSWPEDFDPVVYLAYNEDVAQLFVNLTVKERHNAAAIHYKNVGHKQRRIYKRIHVILGCVS